MSQKRITPLEKIVKILRQLILEKDEEIENLRILLNRRNAIIKKLKKNIQIHKSDNRELSRKLLTKNK